MKKNSPWNVRIIDSQGRTRATFRESMFSDLILFEYELKNTRRWIYIAKYEAQDVLDQYLRYAHVRGTIIDGRWNFRPRRKVLERDY